MPNRCLTARIVARCDVCDDLAEPLHLPGRVHGFYCPTHCPECHQPGASGPQPAGSLPEILERAYAREERS